MKITSAKFIKGATGTDAIFDDHRPMVALVGRSNAGKSSLINALVNRKDLARSSSRPGSTQEINVYLVNRDLYLLDLPGYGFVQKTKVGRERFQKIVEWYLFRSGYPQHKVVLLVDTNVGLTNDDFEMFRSLEVEGKDLIIVANKVDKVKPSELVQKLADIQNTVGGRAVIPFSSTKRIGVGELWDAIKP